MKKIRSKDNQTYKEALRLLRKKYRDQTRLFLLEGPRPVMDALKSGKGLETVFIRESAAAETAGTDAEELAALCGELIETLNAASPPAASPAATPICPSVLITRGPPRPTCVQLKQRPTMKRLPTFRE